MKKQCKNKSLFLIVLTLFLFVLFSIIGQAALPVFASTEMYTSVLADLQKDSSFNVADYPEYSSVSEFPEDVETINIIQVAESTDGKLLIYTYQPMQRMFRFVATSINMSLTETSDGDDLDYDLSYGNDFVGHTGDVSSPDIVSGGVDIGEAINPDIITCSENGENEPKNKDYDLMLISSSGVFSKYVVNNFSVSGDLVRFYNIASIYRPWNKFLDVDVENANEVAVKVGRCWTAHTVGDKVYYTNETVDVVEITDLKSGSIRYGTGYDWWKGTACDSHFVAFNTDWNIDCLLEADVSFEYRKFNQGMWGNLSGDGWLPAKRTVTYEERGSTNSNIFGGMVNRTWERIQTGYEFAKNCANIDESVAQEIQSYQWVLSYFETDYEDETGGVFGWLCWVANIFGYEYQHGTQVANVSVLRLKFVSEGKVYDLGVVSNQSSTSPVVGGDYKDFGTDVGNFFSGIWNSICSFFVGVPWWVWLIIGVVVVAIIVGIVAWAVHKVRGK